MLIKLDCFAYASVLVVLLKELELSSIFLNIFFLDMGIWEQL